jgi:hypothetical protein
VSKESSFYDEAERQYIFGRNLEEIAGLLPVSIASLSRWCAKGSWKDKRKAALSTRNVAESLREVLQMKINTILTGGDLSRSQADEIAKISAVIERMERGSYDFKAAAVEVMRKFVDWLRPNCKPEERQLISTKIQAWFESLV